MSNNKSSDSKVLGVLGGIAVFGGIAMMGAGMPYFWLPMIIGFIMGGVATLQN